MASTAEHRGASGPVCLCEALEPRLMLSAGPVVVSHSPVGVVGPDAEITVTFDQPVDPLTLDTDDLRLTTPLFLASSYTAARTYAVSVQGDRAYMATGLGLHVMDVSDPFNPQLEGIGYVSGTAKDVVVDGLIAYVADEYEGLYVFDVSGSHPTTIGTTSDEGTDLALSGDILFIADTHRLAILSVADPAHPVLLGEYVEDTTILTDVAVSSGTAYLTTLNDGVLVIDVTDPSAPVGINTLPGGTPRGIDIQGSLAYIGMGSGGLQITDVSDPMSPTPVGNFDISGEDFRSVRVSGTMAYVADLEGGLHIIDVSDPSAPVPAGFFPTVSRVGVDVADGTMYIADYDDDLVIVDVVPEARSVSVVDPSTVSFMLPAGLDSGVHEFSIGPAITDGAGHPMDQDGDGTAGQIPQDTYIFSIEVDATPPTRPVVDSVDDDTGVANDGITSDTTLTYTWQTSSDNTGVAGYEYEFDEGDWTAVAGLSVEIAATEGQHRFRVRAVDQVGNRSYADLSYVTIDTTAPTAPTDLDIDGAELLWTATDEVGLWYYQYRQDGGAWVDVDAAAVHTGLPEGASATFDVRAIDLAGNVSAPATISGTIGMGPYIVSHTPDGVVGPVTSLTVTFSGSVDPTTMTIADIPGVEPASPSLATIPLDEGERIYAPVVRDGLLYEAGTAGLRIFDVTDPAAPALLGTWMGSDAYAITLAGQRVYLGTTSTLEIVDVSDPTAPQWVGEFTPEFGAMGIAVQGHLAFANGIGGLEIIDVSDPGSPVVVGSFAHSYGRSLLDVTVSGSTAYLSGSLSTELLILDMSDPSTPVQVGSYHYPHTGQGHDVVIEGSLSYWVDIYGEFSVVDLSDPAAPATLSESDLGERLNEIAIAGSTLCITTGDDGLLTFDVSDPTSPFARGRYDMTLYSVGLSIADNKLFVPKHTDGVEIIQLPWKTTDLVQVDATTWRVSLDNPLPLGDYLVRVGPNVRNVAGDSMDQDRDGRGAEPDDDVYAFGFTTAGPKAGDADLNGAVDLDDFVILKQNFATIPASWGQGDFSGNGQVDLDDFVILKQNFGTGAASAAPVDSPALMTVGPNVDSTPLSPAALDSVGGLLGRQLHHRANTRPNRSSGRGRTRKLLSKWSDAIDDVDVFRLLPPLLP